MPRSAAAASPAPRHRVACHARVYPPPRSSIPAPTVVLASSAGPVPRRDLEQRHARRRHELGWPRAHELELPIRCYEHEELHRRTACLELEQPCACLRHELGLCCVARRLESACRREEEEYRRTAAMLSSSSTALALVAAPRSSDGSRPRSSNAAWPAQLPCAPSAARPRASVSALRESPRDELCLRSARSASSASSATRRASALRAPPPR
ncbi:hypothetical protein PR202_ga05919 [Eleusine coracana subsp. coracana]|uniref:Uncharacterized protein n=1 Tax=Eleusine coracana subsp. coracana TaxID=191504 RepID=A0AAV5BUV0_ELECO|nr:hypothetical protein PR202_ga05919 [Eleusine coracana subsp. coracana]